MQPGLKIRSKFSVVEGLVRAEQEQEESLDLERQRARDFRKAGNVFAEVDRRSLRRNLVRSGTQLRLGHPLHVRLGDGNFRQG